MIINRLSLRFLRVSSFLGNSFQDHRLYLLCGFPDRKPHYGLYHHIYLSLSVCLSVYLKCLPVTQNQQILQNKKAIVK